MERITGNKDKESEPPPHDRSTYLFWIRNFNRYISNSLLYLRWAPFGYPVGVVKPVIDPPRIFHHRKNSRLDKLVSNSLIRSWLSSWML